MDVLWFYSYAGGIYRGELDTLEYRSVVRLKRHIELGLSWFYDTT